MKREFIGPFDLAIYEGGDICKENRLVTNFKFTVIIIAFLKALGSPANMAKILFCLLFG